MTYRGIANLVRKENFAVTIAFIPWNHNRSDPETVGLFAANAARLSICVHGCDHTACEFAAVDEAMLNWKVSLARKRMEQHKRKFALPYDNVMVFPHGIFSKESMTVLRRRGFAAAVSSRLLASNYTGGLKLGHMISPATTHYGMPLFLRRYPRRVEDFAYDLFFGRPALIVQHNADFADGWDKILSFINRLNALATRSPVDAARKSG